MDISQCKHLRVRDSRDYNMDIEEFIKSIEMQFKINFTSLPQWKELIEIMNIVQTDYKMKIQNAANRKYQILQNIFVQNSRPSPFELTDKFARTSKFWENMKLNLRKRKASKDQPLIKSNDDVNQTLNSQTLIQETMDEVSINKFQAHPNTEEVQSNQLLVERPDTELELKSPISARLPVNIGTNQHKMISPLGSNYTPLINPEIDLSHTQLKLDSTEENNFTPTQTKLIKFYPNKIIITNDTTEKQSMKLFLTNCCTEYLHLQFKKISDYSYFKNIKIFPCTPIKLYPGLKVILKLIYSLKNKNDDNIISSIHLRISRNVIYETSEEALIIPIESSFIKSRTIAVTETVYIPSNYSWQVTPKLGYPKAVVHIKNQDDACYYLHIRKKNVDFTKELGESLKSNDVESADSESLVRRIDDIENELQSTILSTPNTNQMTSKHFDELINNDNDLVSAVDIVVLVLNDIIGLVLEPFIFKQTYLRIPSRSKKLVIVYFTRVHHVGCHQSYYDFIFNDSEDDNITITKTIKVFAEVLPHPITLHPKILDMSKSPTTFGYLEDNFTITNSHKIFPVTIKIKTTTKMKKIFKITPMETLVPAQSSAKFYVKICTRNNLESTEFDDLAYFTIKILIIGHKSVYQNVPPLFYEIIAPCGTEFKRIYGTKYFSDAVDSSVINVNNLAEPL
ncbi:uncharacterized protein [Maniola hyperantus]|uniref:uncharacterized protein n=1 Tax=Aphantopus hyperantus TaxID=2795564 RepID=UPI001569C95D|nr:uncharacterized protein LOC117991991 [Maniola hyperantus]